MKVLIIGSGGREHAIGEAVKKNPKVKELYFAPGNGGTATLGTNINIEAIDIKSLVNFSEQEKIDMTIVGPEDPLCLGIVDEFRSKGLKIFGPSKRAAQLEGSKNFSKEFMLKYNIPTGKSVTSKDFDQALSICKEYLQTKNKVVLKADGLCQGKGVVIAENLVDCEAFLKKVILDKAFGDTEILVEEYLEGFETSILAFTDGKTIKAMPTVKDHKRHLEGEKGLNTGGMGTYSPNQQAEGYLEEIYTKVLKPTLIGIQKEGFDYKGIVFVGLMIGSTGIKVLEYNTRFGDPETQSLLQRIDSDLLDLIESVVEGNLENTEIKINDKKVITLVITSGGYPLKYEKGFEINGLEALDIKAFHGGTKRVGEKIFTNGGRVLSLTAVGDSFQEVTELVYNNAKKISFEKARYRNDIFPGVKRIYIEKKAEFENGVLDLRKEIEEGLKIKIDNIKIFNRYDLENLSDLEIENLSGSVFGERPVDNIYLGNEALRLQKEFSNPICVKYHEGQFDIREEGLLDTIQVAIEKDQVKAKVSKVYDFIGENLTTKDLEKIKSLLINPIDQEEGEVFSIPNTLEEIKSKVKGEHYYIGFTTLNKKELELFRIKMALAMSYDDLELVQGYFKEEGREPSETEISIIDTYWSDHCRHTTFNTHLEIQELENPKKPLDRLINRSLKNYLDLKDKVASHKPLTLMDLATIQSRYMVSENMLPNLDISEEINACSFKSKVRLIDSITKESREEDYLIMFKNETHNHPTEIEPFGGASTCLGGAIRDPLSGRAYVYQAMRITGSGDPREDIDKTLIGKLPQRKITLGAANGYSSYGNQIGLCTGFVDEIYHPGFVAKRMEVGAVIGAAPAGNVIRKSPISGDVVVIIGGRTGRDGVGGATGSSKIQKEDSLATSSAEVQKGNPITERKIQRLFRNPEVTKLIKRCNDFGAGGVCVAIGEIAESLEIDLDKVLLKYQGLTGREIAISESQERMAVVIKKEGIEEFKKLCESENLEYSLVAEVTDTKRVVMNFNGEKIVDISRAFLDTNGAKRKQQVEMVESEEFRFFEKEDSTDIQGFLIKKLSDLNITSKKDLIQKFDSSIGRNSVLSPLGGKHQITPVQGMVSRIPSLKGESTTCSIMTYGYNPNISEENPYLGGYYAVIESLCKIASIGGNPLKAYLSFQEYFESLNQDKVKWSKVLEALLGAFEITHKLNIPPIGGKDSMSGTYKDLTVPSTLISFGVTTEEIENIISPELKGNKKLGIIKTKKNLDHSLDLEDLKNNFKTIKREIERGNIVSCTAITHKGTLVQLVEMALGNDIGFNIELKENEIFEKAYGGFIVEYIDEVLEINEIGNSKNPEDSFIVNGIKLEKNSIYKAYTSQLKNIFKPENKALTNQIIEFNSQQMKQNFKSKLAPIIPKVIIPIFPGTNCEWDTSKAFEQEGAIVETYVFKNRRVFDIQVSIEELAEKITNANILVFPGGFSLGDEPDGSGKFIASIIRNTKIKSAIEKMLETNDGLILGICNGFQGLIKSGLLPYGKIQEPNEGSPTLTYNDNLRHVARMVDTLVNSTSSPWLSQLNVDETYRLPISHGEGRFICSAQEYEKLKANNQIAFTYIDNPNGSDYDIEGIVSPCGKILGKMAHSERLDPMLYKNIPGIIPQPIIKNGVEYFK